MQTRDKSWKVENVEWDATERVTKSELASTAGPAVAHSPRRGASRLQICESCSVERYHWAKGHIGCDPADSCSRAPLPPYRSFPAPFKAGSTFQLSSKVKGDVCFWIFPLILVLGGGDICATLLVGRLGCHGEFALRAMSAHSLPARPGDSPDGVYVSILFQTTSSDKEGPRETATTFSGGEDPTQQRCIRIRQQVFMNHDTCASVICCFGCTLRLVLLQQVIRAPSFCSKQTANTYSAVC